MQINKCLNPKCGKEITHVPGRRKKQFCSSTCKSLVWYEKNKDGKAKEYRRKRKLAKSKVSGQQTNQVKDLSEKPPASNYSLNLSTEKDEVLAKIAKYEEEMNSLGTGAFASQRKKWLKNEIYRLKTK